MVLNFVSFFLLEFQNLEYNRVNKKATIKFLVFSRGRGFCSYNTQIPIFISKFSFLVLVGLLDTGYCPIVNSEEVE